jgi:type I restriction enzyme, S subunit
MKNITKGDVLSLTVTIPTLPEQRKIADFLTAVDGRIGQLSQKKALLEDYKKGVMQQLFTQAIRFKDDHGNDFPDWEEKTIGDFLTAYRGGAALKPSDFCTTGSHLVFPKKYVVSGGELPSDRGLTYCTEGFFESNGASVIDSSYLITTLRDLVPSGPSIGYIVKYDNDELYMLAQGVYGLQVDEGELDRRFLIQFSNTSTYRRWMRKIKVGSTQVHIRIGDFKGFAIGVPTLPEQRKIVDFLSAIDRKIESVATQITETQTFKRGLLQQMFV